MPSLSFRRTLVAHGYHRHQKPRDQRHPAISQRSHEQLLSPFLPQEDQKGQREQQQEEEADEGGHRHTQQLPVGHLLALPPFGLIFS